MSRGKQIRLAKTTQIPKPSYYISALMGEFSSWAFTEEEALNYKGLWQEKVFNKIKNAPMDLEIGTGNGYYFAHYAAKNPERSFLGIELKYKPLIQSIRRAVQGGCQNARVLRYNAVLLSDLFEEKELNHVFIHFPDPWEKKSQKKHRLIQSEFLKTLFFLQRENSFVEFKTDSQDYFDFAKKKFEESPYEVEILNFDLHRSPWAHENFVTSFEALFLKRNQPIYYLKARKK